MLQDLAERRRLTALAAAELDADSRGDESFRRLVALAAETFRVSATTLSIMTEDEQVHFACQGFDSVRVPREHTFCRRTIELDTLQVVLDASLDPRWSGNSHVVGPPFLRFYAGVPVRLDGEPIGTFCLIDGKPRNRFTAADRQRLERFATLAAELLELRRLRREHRSGMERFHRMAQTCPDAMIVVDGEGALRFWNAGAERLFGHSEAEALSLSAADLLPARLRYGPGEFAAAFDPMVGLTREIDARLRDGSSCRVELSLARWDEGGEVFYGGVLRDVSERRATEDALHRLAHHDGLTELPNRTVMRMRLAGALSRGENVAVLLVDLDGFKDVNDTLGHAVGDEVLRAAAGRLLECVDPTDTVTRLGGDEFVVLLSDCGDPLRAAATAERIVAALGEPFRLDEQAVQLGASVGVAIGPAQAPNADDLMSCADLALYQAKADGRHCRRLFTPALRAAADDRRRFSNEFVRALERNEFELHYQPQVRLDDLAVVGAEALIRWRHPEHGLLLPGAFLGAMRASRHEAAVGSWVMRESCRQAAGWRQAGARELRMGVNGCGAGLRSPDYASSVFAILAETGLPAANLELEITETTVLRDDDLLVANLAGLRAAGVGIAFDDYGTGYASLSLLKRFPLSRLKIDRSFVREMGEVADVAIIRAILHLGHGFGLDVIAEGIETEDQLARLRRKGCTEGQGFLFSPALPAAEFERRFLAGRRPAFAGLAA